MNPTPTKFIMISIRNLKKSFGDNRVLDGVDLEVNPGETMVVIGPSGCGKSVLLKHIMGILKPDEGEIIIYDKDITLLKERELNEMRKKFGMLFQGAALFDSLSVEENVGFGLREHTNLSEREIKEIVQEKLRMVGLGDIAGLKPAELSGGMRKRVGLARAIAMGPEIVFYDEPTTGVDPIMGDIINNLILELHNRLSITSVAVTHDMNSAYKIADRMAMLYEGRIIEIGSVEAIKNTQNPVVRQFIRGTAEGPISI
ncbi:ABC transporter ATP-binding protein [candidate division NPL-UPA2 bacterium]|nr:ABC transporter ATP-binding protein [candidate division NPL-UPA2 bacterium]